MIVSPNSPKLKTVLLSASGVVKEFLKLPVLLYLYLLLAGPTACYFSQTLSPMAWYKKDAGFYGLERISSPVLPME